MQGEVRVHRRASSGLFDPRHVPLPLGAAQRLLRLAEGSAQPARAAALLQASETATIAMAGEQRKRWQRSRWSACWRGTVGKHLKACRGTDTDFEGIAAGAKVHHPGSGEFDRSLRKNALVGYGSSGVCRMRLDFSSIISVIIILMPAYAYAVDVNKDGSIHCEEGHVIAFQEEDDGALSIRKSRYLIFEYSELQQGSVLGYNEIEDKSYIGSDLSIGLNIPSRGIYWYMGKEEKEIVEEWRKLELGTEFYSEYDGHNVWAIIADMYVYWPVCVEERIVEKWYRSTNK